MNNLKDLGEQNTPVKTRRKREIPYFLRTLHQILQDEKFAECVAWSDEGDGVLLKKPEEFATEVLPQYFKHKSLSSFVRQLNMYNFKKERLSNNLAVYKHPFFKKGQEQMLKLIRRKKTSKVPENQQVKSKKLKKIEKSHVFQEDESMLVSTNKQIKQSCETMLKGIENLEVKANTLLNSNMQLEQQIRLYEGALNQRSIYGQPNTMNAMAAAARTNWPSSMNFFPNGNVSRFSGI